MAKASFSCCLLTPDLSLGLPIAASKMDLSPEEEAKQ
jgi:hypothetical protein